MDCSLTYFVSNKAFSMQYLSFMVITGWVTSIQHLDHFMFITGRVTIVGKLTYSQCYGPGSNPAGRIVWSITYKNFMKLR